MITDTPPKNNRPSKLIRLWSITFLLLFPFLVILSLVMLLHQGGLIDIGMGEFYTYMTLHGLGMKVVVYSMAFAVLWHFMGTRYVELNIDLAYNLFYIILISLGILIITTFIGKFGAGGSLLYPLPFKGSSWTNWSTGLTFFAVFLLFLTWLIGAGHILLKLHRKYGRLSALLGWEVLRIQEKKAQTSSMLHLSSINLIMAILTLLIGIIVVSFQLLQYITPTMNFDPMLMKNMQRFSEAAILNISLLYTVVWACEIIPGSIGREHGAQKILIFGWNNLLGLFLIVFISSIVNSFVPYYIFQVLGDMGESLMIFIAIITLLYVLVKDLDIPINAFNIPLILLIGLCGWAIGGFAAIISSYYGSTGVFHNTLWDLASLHTTVLLGFFPLVLGFLLFRFTSNISRRDLVLVPWGFGLYLLGGGFVLTQFIGGIGGVPRNFSGYTGIEAMQTQATGIITARTGVLFLGICFIGLGLLSLLLLKRVLVKKDEVKVL